VQLAPAADTSGHAGALTNVGVLNGANRQAQLEVMGDTTWKYVKRSILYN